MKKALFLLVLLVSQACLAQKINLDCFIRSPQVYTIGLSEKSQRFSPLLSGGFSLYGKGAFVDIGIFLGDRKAYGYYAFTGIPLYQYPVKASWMFVTNAFGEATFLPTQSEASSSWVYTAGISPVLFRSFSRSSLALALTLGGAYSQEKFSLNTRLVLNYSVRIFN